MEGTIVVSMSTSLTFTMTEELYGRPTGSAMSSSSARRASGRRRRHLPYTKRPRRREVGVDARDTPTGDQLGQTADAPDKQLDEAPAELEAASDVDRRDLSTCRARARRRRRRTRRERAVGSARSRARRPRGRGRARWNRVYSRTAFTATFRRRHPPRGRSGQRSTPARGGRSSTRRRLQRRRGRLRCCCSRR
jgi:hypothetical protein